MCDWNVNDIVDILVKDKTLLEARKIFGRYLSIPWESLREFEDSYQSHCDIHAYLCYVIEKWKSTNENQATISLLSNILKENKFAASAERLLFLNHHTPAKISVFGVKNPVFNFVGREKELNYLNELFQVKKASVTLISAMGGKGKTELCRRFIQQLPKDVETFVVWISGDDPQQFQHSLSEVGQEMNVNTTDSGGNPLLAKKIIQNISNKRKSNWVVVIDNVDEVFPEFYKALDSFLRNGAFVVIISRRSDIQSEKVIFLKDLEDVDAWEFVISSLGEIPSQKLVIELCKCLQNYPLALQQAVGFINHKKRLENESYGIMEYLQELNSDTSKVFDHEILLTGYDSTIIGVFELTISKIMNTADKPKQKQSMFYRNIHKFFKPHNERYEHSTAFTLLQILSLVQPDGIETTFLTKLFSYLEKKELFNSSISILKSFTLVGITKGEIYVHRIVQKLTRGKMKTENMFALITNKLLENIDVDKLTRKNLVQIFQIWKNAVSEPQIIRKNSNYSIKISERLFELSLYREMKDFSEITLQKFVPILDQDHIDTLRMQYMLAKALLYNGEYEEALVKFQELWKNEKKVLGKEHEEILNCENQIANVFYRLKRFDESLKWHNRVLKSKVKFHGENHQSTMITKNNMALVLNKQGKSEEALSIYKQVLEWREKNLGHGHPQTLMTRHSIAFCLYGQGNFVDAKKRFEEVLEWKIKKLGEEHAETLSTKYWLSATLHSFGQEEKSLEMMEQVLISQEKVLGTNHPYTIVTRDQISKGRKIVE